MNSATGWPLKNSGLCFPELFSWLLAHINGDSQPGFTTKTHNQTWINYRRQLKKILSSFLTSALMGGLIVH